MPSTITAEIVAPDFVHLPSDKRKTTVEVDVLCRLHNDGNHDRVVGSAHPNDVHNWHVLSETHREVMRPPAEKAAPVTEGDVHPHVAETVPAGHSHNSTHTLVLDAGKLRAGKRYTIRSEYHGHMAEASFVVLAGHAPSRRPRTAVKKRASK